MEVGVLAELVLRLGAVGGWLDIRVGVGHWLALRGWSRVRIGLGWLESWLEVWLVSLVGHRF